MPCRLLEGWECPGNGDIWYTKRKGNMKNGLRSKKKDRSSWWARIKKGRCAHRVSPKPIHRPILSFVLSKLVKVIVQGFV